jgi:hyperosmotically inducible periplasmic protein
MLQRILSWTLAATLLTACGGRAISSTMDDAAITAQVKTALLNDTQVNATKIDVSTSNGVVTVSGVVRSKPEQDRVVQLARGVNGVKDVKANLTVGG